MAVENFIYNVANTKTYGHIMVDVNNWQSDRILMQVNLKGKLLPTFITNVVKINPAPAYRPVPFKEDSLVALSSIATRIGLLRPFTLPNDTNVYANVHLSQVLGYFEDNKIDINKFIPLYDKVVMKKVEVPTSTSLQLISDNMSVGEVIKVGTGGFDNEWNKRPMDIKVGSKVLIRDNVTTTLSIDGEEYFVTDDSNIVGEFLHDEINLNFLEIYGDISIFKEYVNEKIEGSFLFKPVLDSDISQLYQENLFEHVVSKKFEQGVYVINRFDTEYVIFKGETYFVVPNDKVIARKIVD